MRAGSTVLPDGSVHVDLVPGLRNSDRFPTYARLDAKASRAFPLRRGRLRLEVEVVNLTDRANPCCSTLEGAFPGEPLRVGTETWLPLIVNLGFEYRWRRK